MKRISVKNVSSVLETAPVGKIDQPDFLNCIVQCSTDMYPAELMQTLLQIEEKIGRVRKEKWGPRTIDCDILFFHDEIIDTDELKIPHPEFTDRPFLIQLMKETAPKFIHPTLKKSMEQLYEHN